jgi:hypothetical protein
MQWLIAPIAHKGAAVWMVGRRRRDFSASMRFSSQIQ